MSKTYDYCRIEAAVDATLDEMPDNFLIRKFLLKNKAEVKGMFLTEYDQEKVLAYERLEGIQQGIEQGIERGIQQGIQQGIERGIERGIGQNQEQVASDMLRENYPLSAIKKISRLSEDVILKLANSLGVTAI